MYGQPAVDLSPPSPATPSNRTNRTDSAAAWEQAITPTALSNGNSTNISTPEVGVSNVTQIQPLFTATHTIWQSLCFLNSVIICIFVWNKAAELRLPQHRLLLHRLSMSKYFWTQLLLLVIAVMYDGRQVYDEYEMRTLSWSANEQEIRKWFLPGFVMNMLDKIFAFIVACYFNYAKPFGVPRTRGYLRWMKFMYMATLMAYTLDQAFSMLFEGLKASLQAVTGGEMSIRFSSRAATDHREQVILFLLLVFSLAYRYRLLEVFSDKMFYRNKDVFDIPRNNA